ncbi:MAG: PAS domain S-box protein [Rubrivivax sp.]|nr:MAG: PAS domain S-box protein [Rubrivivax sp.]
MEAPAKSLTDATLRVPGPAVRDRYWWSLAALWTLSVAMGATWLIHEKIDAHRAELQQNSQHRLNSLSDSLQVTFQQLDALPRALGRLGAIHAFLHHPVVDNPALLEEDDRERTKATLIKRSDVRDISALLRQTADDFSIHDIYVMDRFGNVLANARINEKVTVLGANFRTRVYFSEALDSGHGFQFAVGRITNIPGFFFASRLSEGPDTLGVIAVKQAPSVMQRLFDDPQRLLFVTDPQGVIVMGGAALPMLSHAPLEGPLTMEPDQARRLYMRTVPTLPWQVRAFEVNGRDSTLVTIQGQSYLAQQKPLGHGGLTAWTLTPMRSEEAIRWGWLGASGLVLISGYWGLAHLRQREHRLRVLMQAQDDLSNMAHALPLVVFRYHQPERGPGRFTFIGHGLKAILGIDPDTLAQDPDMAWRLARLSPLRPPTEGIEFAVTTDGKTRWVRCDSQPSHHADGSTTYNGYWLDVTDHKQTRARSEAVFRYAPLGFLFFDEQGHIVRANDAAVALFGASSEQALLGLLPSMPPLSPPIDRDDQPSLEERRAILRKIEQREIFRFDWKHTRLDGERFDAEIVVIPFEEDGQRQICTIMQDITPRKKAEAAMLEARQAAEAAMHAKSRFLANMWHDPPGLDGRAVQPRAQLRREGSQGRRQPAARAERHPRCLQDRIGQAHA